MPGHAFAISRRLSAFHCGHVAWGYTRDEGARTFYSFGSVEDPSGLPFAPPSAMAFWSITAEAGGLRPILEQLDRFHYTDFKRWEVADPDPLAADRVAAEQGSKPYWVFTNNCLDSVHRVLTAYGVRHPHIHDPARPGSWIPNRWFDRIPFESGPIAGLEDALREARPTPTS